MALNTNDLSKQYYSVTPIQDLEQIDINDLTLNSEGEVDLIPIGLHGRTISNSISLRDLQTAIDTIGYIPQEAQSGNTLELTIGGLMSKLDKWNLDHFNLKNGNALGSLRNILSSVLDENYQLGKGAISLGCNTKASGLGSYALGASNNSWFGTFKTEATGYGSHAEGCGTLASGKGAHALGVLQEGGNDEAFQTKAIGEGSHAEGCGTLASGHGSHAEGLSFDGKNAGVPHLYSLKATGEGSHAGGAGTEAIGNYSTTQGLRTRAINKSQTVIGEFNIADNTGSSSTRGKYAFIIGNGNDNGLDLNYSNALTVDWDGKVESFGGYATQDNHLTTKGYVDNTINNAINSIDIGLQNLVDGEAIGSVQGILAEASGSYAFALGYGTIASGPYSHAEGTIDDLNNNISSGFGSHTEGVDTQASDYGAHAEGALTIAQGIASHAEGYVTKAIGNYSHTSGRGTVASGENEFVIGRYNKFLDIEEEVEDILTILIDINNMSLSYTLLQTPIENTLIICKFDCLNDQEELIASYQISFITGQADGDQHNWLSGTYDGDKTFTFNWSGTEEELLLTKLKIKGVSIEYETFQLNDNNIFVIGNGTDDSHRSNLFEVNKNGNVTIQGDIAVQGNIINSSNSKYIPFPVGSIQIYAGSICPNGWMFCDGREVSRTEYSKLFEALGGTDSRWGTGDGSTTFNIPDLRGRFPLGFNGNSLPNGNNSTLSVRNFGSRSGSETIPIGTTNLPAHTHSIPNGQFSTRWTLDGGDNKLVYSGSGLFEVEIDRSASAKPVTFNASATSDASKGRNIVKVQNQKTGSVGSGTPLNIMPPYAVINFIIYHGKED